MRHTRQPEWGKNNAVEPIADFDLHDACGAAIIQFAIRSHHRREAFMQANLRFRFAVMMFLEYLIWGAWLPLLTPYLKDGLHFSGTDIAWIQNTFAIASLVGLLGGQLADRFFAVEKYLFVSHLIGGVTMLILPSVTDFWTFFAVMMVHCLAYVPTLSLTNAICFANLRDAQKDFGPVRLWGTIGWIAASWPLVFLMTDWARVPSLDEAGFVTWLGSALGTVKEGDAKIETLKSIFYVAGIASLALSAFSLTLPHTPPQPANADAPPLARAIKVLAIPSILVLFVVTFLDSLVHYCYFFWTGAFLEKNVGIPTNWIMPVMSIGQIAEILTMAYLGFFLRTLGWRTTMTLGILGHALRFFLFAIATPDMKWLVILINVVHGFCYAFFFASVYIFVDEHFPKDARASAQSLFNLLIFGVGPFVGNFLWGALGDRYTDPQTKEIDFHQLFLWPTGVALAAAVFLFVAFWPPRKVDIAADETGARGHLTEVPA